MKNIKNLSTALVYSSLIGAGCLALYYMMPDGPVKRIAVMAGGDIAGGGYIQVLTYVAFFWAWFETQDKLKAIKKEKRYLHSGIIPVSERHIFQREDIHQLKFKLVDQAKKEHSILIDLLKKACFKFRSADSLGELIDIVSVQVEIYQEKAESDQSIIRYLAWVIPSIGFVGTVLGISQSLSLANTGDMNAITTALALAFDTTFVALVLSIVIMWQVHALQEASDKFHSDIKEFVIENFINKIELS